MSVAFETSSSHLTSQTHSKRSDRRSVGFAGHEDDLDDQEPVKQINLADIGIRFKSEEVVPIPKKNGKIIIYFGDKMASQDDNEEIVRESLSDMDPGLLFAANHFVEDLLVKAQEEASRRQTSEKEGLLREPDRIFGERHQTEVPSNVKDRIRKRWRSFYALFIRCIGGLQE